MGPLRASWEATLSSYAPPLRSASRQVPVSQTWLLGGRRFAQGRELERRPGCAWHLVHGEDRSWLLQLWAPRPDPRELDRLREVHLQRFLAPEPWDPWESRFGHDADKAWLLQPLSGAPLSALWPGWSLAARRAFLARLHALLRTGHAPRLLDPDTVGIQPGRLLLPRVLGEPPRSAEQLVRDLKALGAPAGSEPPLFDEAPSLAGDWPRPLRGRSRELTYLKSLALGFAAPVPMERVIVLSGEEGQDQERLAAWTAAAAETEGLWVARHEAAPGEAPGALPARLLQDLLQGLEADFYARNPDTARALSRRLEAFAFLRGPWREAERGPLAPEEREAFLKVLDFAAELHPRLVMVTGLECADPALQADLAELVRRSRLPWLLSAAAPTPAALPRALFGALRGVPDTAFVAPGRLEDAELRAVAEDLLGPHALPEAYLEAACRESLGNPGLLQRVLELAQLQGELLRREDRWGVAEDAAPPRIREDLAAGILEGRLHRLGTAALTVVRLLALAEQPLDQAILGHALGLAGDPLEDALRPALAAHIVVLKEGHASLADPRLRELARSGLPPGETRRLARGLLKALDGAAGHPTLSVGLRALASDPATALAQVLEAAERHLPEPLEAERVLQQALALNPALPQRAQLWEFLSDAWAAAPGGQGAPGESPRIPALEALGRAQTILEGLPNETEALARVLRKRALLELELRRLPEALASIQTAAACLAKLPRHPEQARLRLALGRIHLMEGHPGKGVKALEEGLQLLQACEEAGCARDTGLLLLELGCAQAERGQFQRGLASLRNAQRLLETERAHGPLSRVLLATASVHQLLGQADTAHDALREALGLAKGAGDAEAIACGHLQAGIARSREQSLGPALAHLEEAQARLSRLGDRPGAARARAWRARTLAALGDGVHADMELAQALAVPSARLSAAERGEHAFLQAEIAGFREAWTDAARLYAEAARVFGAAGLAWRECLARLRTIQAEAQGAEARGAGNLDAPWSLLEALKAPSEGAGSRWLDLEWHRAHALLLSATSAGRGSLGSQGLAAWSEVLAAARELRFPALTLEANAGCARILLEQGEHLGAVSRLREAFGALQELWSRVPEAHAERFLERPDLHRFQATLAAAGLRFALPERPEPLSDWTPTQALASVGPSAEAPDEP